MKKIQCYNSNRINESLSNLCFMGRCSGEELRLKLLETKTDDDFINTAERLTELEWEIVKSDENIIQIRYKDRLGNIKYLVGEKEKSEISQEKINKAKNILQKYGIDKSDTDLVLDLVYTVLFNKSIYDE